MSKFQFLELLGSKLKGLAQEIYKADEEQLSCFGSCLNSAVPAPVALVLVLSLTIGSHDNLDHLPVYIIISYITGIGCLCFDLKAYTSDQIRLISLHKQGLPTPAFFSKF